MLCRWLQTTDLDSYREILDRQSRTLIQCLSALGHILALGHALGRAAREWVVANDIAAASLERYRRAGATFR